MEILCVGLCFLPPIGIVICVVVLRSACKMHNRLLGGGVAENAVPIPPVRQAAVIVVVSVLIGGIVAGTVALATRLIDWVVGLLRGDASPATWEVPPTAHFLSLIGVILAHADLLATVLPTTFAKGILITLLEFVMLLVIVSLAVALMLGVLTAAGGLAWDGLVPRVVRN